MSTTMVPGRHSTAPTNYSLNEYARDIVYSIMEVCDAEGVPHPTIVSESGRAIVAHHSVLIVEAFGSIEKSPDGERIEATNDCPSDRARHRRDLRKPRQKESPRRTFMTPTKYANAPRLCSTLGLLDLRAKAKIETVYWQIAGAVVAMFRGMRYIPEEVKEMEVALGDQFLCNFSVFQSLLDHWALGQLVPGHADSQTEQASRPQRYHCRHHLRFGWQSEQVRGPARRQGNSAFAPLGAGRTVLHRLFLVGAYQDIMGDMHNLFGRVNEMHIYLDEDEDCGYYVEEVLPGSTIGQVLSLTQWDTNEIARRMKSQVDAAIKSDRLKPSEAMRVLDDYEKCLSTYTYLNFEDQKRRR